ncbi:MAG: hypothetical protein M3Y78_13755, partial [Pseudomonadota bacterium]|nr:hypothetical protein [Pseudomonadota bacterium]
PPAIHKRLYIKRVTGSIPPLFAWTICLRHLRYRVRQLLRDPKDVIASLSSHMERSHPFRTARFIFKPQMKRELAS